MGRPRNVILEAFYDFLQPLRTATRLSVTLLMS